MTTHTTSSIECATLSNGMTLLVEPNPSVASCAMTWLLPVGSAADDDASDGRAALLSEMIFRGAGELNSRELSDALDRLGVQRSARAGSQHLRIGATMLGDRLDDALPLLTDIVTRPALADEALEPVRSLCLQTLDGLPDEPQELVSLRLRERHLPPPFNRHGYGDRGALERATIGELRAHWESNATPGRSILALAGAVDADATAARLEELLGGWARSDAPEPMPGGAARGTTHLEQDSSQTHIAMACEAPAAGDPDAVLERLALSVLSGGSSGRLFTEVRQKRSLCYAVSASYGPGRDWGVVSYYAGTTPERAQETLDVSLDQFDRLKNGADEAEFHRAVIGATSSIVMHGESTAARAAAIAGDRFALGRARTLEDRVEEIKSVSLADLNAYLKRRTFGPFTLSTIGPAPLSMGA